MSWIQNITSLRSRAPQALTDYSEEPSGTWIWQCHQPHTFSAVDLL